MAVTARQMVSSMERSFVAHGWTCRKGVASSTLSLKAESESALSFVALSKPRELAALASSTTAEIADTLSDARGFAKAWEAYLFLVVDGARPNDPVEVERIEQDLAYCRKLVLFTEEFDGQSVDDVVADVLSFLFPIGSANSDTPLVDVRQALAKHLGDSGIPEALVQGLLTSFEGSCRCEELILHDAGQRTQSQ